jgi:hypothetical protein
MLREEPSTEIIGDQAFVDFIRLGPDNREQPAILFHQVFSKRGQAGTFAVPGDEFLAHALFGTADPHPDGPVAHMQLLGRCMHGSQSADGVQDAITPQPEDHLAPGILDPDLGADEKRV